MNLSFAQERALIDLFQKLEVARQIVVTEASASIFLTSGACGPAEKSLRDLQTQLLGVLKAGELPERQISPLLGSLKS